jgi:sugar phosphate isomerase/epimerase
MRLGGFYGAETIADLEPLCEDLDRHGLSAIAAPDRLSEMSVEECAEFGYAARDVGIVVGETGMWENLMTRDEDLREARIEKVRTLLMKADAMGCRCVISLVGSLHPSDSFVAPHPYMVTDDAKREFRDIVLRVLDGLDLKTTCFAIEPWCNTFFYEPDDIAEFLASVDHPRLRLHLDQMNMISQKTYYDTTSLIERTFELLADRIVAAHLKDLRWDYEHFMLKWDEVLIGEGVLDYETYLTHLARLPADTPVFCEHLAGEEQYVENFARLRERAGRAGVEFLRRHRAVAG